jgi:hypothetical protein
MLPILLVPGTVYGVDANSIPITALHWVYIQEKHGTRRMKRIGNPFAEVLCPDEVPGETDIQACTEYHR